MPKIKLTEEQEKHYESIKWLVSGERRSGRSFLLAKVYAEKAIANKGCMIKYADHDLSWIGTRAISEYINDMLTKNRYDFKINPQECTVKVNGKIPKNPS